jgi:hypothetical protein
MAATTKVIVPITPMKVSRTIKEIVRFFATKEPYPCKVPQIALPNRMSVVPAASSGQNLKAAQIKKGDTKPLLHDVVLVQRESKEDQTQANKRKSIPRSKTVNSPNSPAFNRW